MIISVVVSTYNRSELLVDCLNSLAEQTNEKSNYEVIVVDNNSTDNTANVVKSFVDRYPNFKYVVETQQGLSHARNRGYKEASGDYVAYIDDDARAHSDWVEQIINFIKQHPDAKAFGGPVFGFCTFSAPAWFPKEYGTWSLGETERILNENEWIIGSNMIYYKKLLVHLGGFNKNLGMNGKQIAYGEETELITRIRALGLPIYYVPDIRVDHLIQAYKLNMRFLLKSRFQNGLNYSNIFNNYSLHKNPYIMFVVNLLRGFWIFVSSKEPFIKTRIYRGLSPIVYSLGSIISYLRR